MKKILCILLILVALTFSACGSERTEFLFGTVVSVRIDGIGKSNVSDVIFKELYAFESLLSANIATSDIGRINSAPVGEAIAVDEIIIALIERARELYIETNGAFNPCMLRISRLWGFDTGLHSVPDSEAITELLAYANMDYVEIDSEARTVTRLSERTLIDLGGIAKGYFCDVAYSTVLTEGIEKAVIDVGGNIYVRGSGRVAVSNPRNGTTYFGILDVENLSVVTSGDYERYFVHGDERYHHILGRDGYPSRSGLISVTMIGSDSMLLDALATAVMVMGYDEAVSLLEGYPDVMCIAIREDRTFGIINDKGIFSLKDMSYERKDS